MDVLNTNNYVYKLRFSIDKDISKDCAIRWTELKNKCENGENKHIVENIKMFCKLEQNKKLPYLERFEGGLGGNDNKLNKQIRFRDNRLMTLPKRSDDDIVLDEICSTHVEKWTYKEIDDLLFATMKAIEYQLESKDCVRCCIDMIPQPLYRY